MARVLLADSQPLFNEALAALFSRSAAHEVVGRCSSAEDTFAHVSSLCPDLVAGRRQPRPGGLAQPGQPHAQGLSRGAGDRARRRPQRRPAAGRDPLGRRRRGGQDLRGQHGAAGRRSGAGGRGGDPTGHAAGAGPPPGRPRPDAGLTLSRLSPRERQVLALLSRGWDNARIGRELFISQHTVHTHIQNILEKLGMHSKLEAATLATLRSAELELTPGGAGLGADPADTDDREEANARR